MNIDEKFSLVIPTMNEESTIGKILEDVKHLTDDLFVIDGHSTDNTKKIVESLGIKFLLDNNLGKGAAVRKALKHAKHPITVFMDADGSHDHRDISKLIKPIQENKADLVMGSRMLGGSDELFGSISEVARLIGSLIISLSINYRFNVRFTDYQNGFRAIRTEVGNKINLKSNKTTIEQEMAMKCLRYRFRVHEVPTHENKRQGGISKVNVFKLFHLYIWNLLSGIFVFKKNKR